MGGSSLRFRAESRETTSDNLSGPLPTVLEPLSDASEAYRALRSSLLYAPQPDTLPRAILITSPDRHEGKSTTCANLGVVLAQAEKSVLLLDCDFRAPTLHKMFALRSQPGITDVMTGMYRLQEVLQEPLPGLKVVTAGPLPPNPAEIAALGRFTELLDQARQGFDYVLVDSPPVGLVSDPLVLASQADGVLLVVDARGTSKTAVRKSVRSLEGVGATVLGTVVNNVRSGKRDTRYDYGYYR